MTAVWTAASMGSTAPSPQAGHWATEPFTVGSDDDFRRLREFLLASNYTEAGFAAGGVPSTYEFEAPSPDRAKFPVVVDLLSLLVHLFLDGSRVPWEAVDRILGPDGRRVFDALGLLQPAIKDTSLCAATISLFPLEGVYMICDRHGGLETIGPTPSDLVYSPLTSEAHRFTDFMPRHPCGDYLEMCSGSGVAALIAAHSFAKNVWGVDITKRSTRFAEFSARLNGLTNMWPLVGDLYAPVAGQTFDRIVAHPPYVASHDTEMVFRDGGEDGEQITRGVIAGLADHLRPGGQFYCDCTMTDRVDSPLEDRIREMLGPKQDEFDLIIGQASITDPVTQYVPALIAGRLTAEVFKQRVDAFNRLNITKFVSVVVLLQRRATVRPVITRRRVMSGGTVAEDFQWLMHYAVTTASWTAAEVDALLDVAPRAAPGIEWRPRMVIEGGQWRPAVSELVTITPFRTEAASSPWFATLLSWCNGVLTSRDILRRLRDAGALSESDSDHQFAQLIRQLADAALLELPDFPMKARK